MKGYFAILTALCILLTLTSCSGKEQKQSEKIPRDPKGEDGAVTILLDAGHGFRDVGCTSEYLKGLYEYELTMDFTKRLEAKLTVRGYNVILTHSGDSYPAEEDIMERADKLKVEYDKEKMTPNNGIFDAYERAVYSSVLDAEGEIDLMLSLHVNANADSDTPTGFEIDYCAENESSDMTKFAFEMISDSIEEEFPGRRLKRFADSWDMSFIVTKYNTMPSILLETGFASTPSDAELLLDAEWRDRLMSSVADGIEKYFSQN